MKSTLPVASWIRTYDKRWFRADVIAGLTVWALVVPQAMAYAQIAGLPPAAGVFASFAAPLGYALFGTSRQLIVSPTSATAAISASLIAPFAIGDVSEYWEYSAALSILCGLMFILLGRLKLGFVSQFIATSVQVGMLFGLGLTIIVGQLFEIFGISATDGPFYKQAWQFASQIGELHGWTTAIGVSGLAAILILQRLAPSLPAALIVVGASILAVTLLDLGDKGVAIVGQVDRAVPLPSVPTIPLEDLVRLVPGVFAIVIIGYSESISVAQGFADEHNYEIKPDQELVALGVSGIAGGLFQGFISGGGASQSAANDRAGAKSQMSGVVLAILAALTSIALMPLFRNLPLAALGAVVISAVMGFLNVPELIRIRNLSRTSLVLAIISLMGVLLLGILPGLLLGVAISVLLLLSRASRPSLTRLGRLPGSSAYADAARHVEARTTGGLLIVRFDAPLIYLNATWFRDHVRGMVEKEVQRPEVLVLDLESSNDLDIRSLDVLTAMQVEYRAQGIVVRFAGLHDRVRQKLERSAIELDPNHPIMFRTVAEAEDSFNADGARSGSD